MRSLLFLSALLSVTAVVAAPAGPASLADAAMREDKAAVRTLLSQKADVDATQADGSTALLWAAHVDDAETVDLLLGAGANPKAGNRYGITPLSEACVNGNAAIIEKLLKAGADPNAPHTEGETPLMTAARTGNPEAVKVLLDHGAKVNTAEAWRGQTALMWAAAENHPDVIKLLVARGASLDTRSKPFDYSSMKAKAGSIGMNWPRGGFTALLFAAREGAVDAARVLLDAGADINLADPDGTTPLLISIVNYHFDMAGFLIERGADLNYADNRGRTPLYAAVDMHSPDVSTRPPTKVEDKLDSLAVIKMLLAHGASPNAQLIKIIAPRGVLDGADGTMGPGSTPFLRAARSSGVEVMKLLLENGANPKMKTADDVTAVMMSAGISYRDGKTRGTEAESVEALKMLLDLGIDVNAVSARSGETAMHGAAGRGADLIVQFLADHGASVNAKDKQGRTPIDSASGVGATVGGVRSPHDSTVALLTKLGGKTGQTEKTAEPKATDEAQ
ncbi:MAG: ankyrin repeat protein [Bryobacterales bacterium]|nr:ankyrin repeat protein [Bryobacterales bacterium]